MGIHFDNPVHKSGSFPVSGTVPENKRLSKTRISEPGSFIRFFKKASGGSVEETSETQPESSLKARKALELYHRMELEMNESLLRIMSDGEEEDRAKNSFMAGQKNILPGKAKEAPLLSRIRQTMSETDQPKVQPAGLMVEKTAKTGMNDSGHHDIDMIIQKAASLYGVDSGLIRGVIEAESNFKPDAVSSKGAMGLMQLMPGTARELGVTDPMDPVENIMAGTRYLKKLLNRYGGSVPHALAAYNWGMGNLDSRRSRMPLETRNYVAKITGVSFS
ncbi:MAG: hypothetical protein A2277_19270 [Desulfobacterales bacterium RIFOXYA12_FULL_46_15]|nr:MAG: hypothetical protein A2277_19270 [Desulfobacterales bacterium RIFOXYA12_FULL_46_15]